MSWAGILRLRCHFDRAKNGHEFVRRGDHRVVPGADCVRIVLDDFGTGFSSLLHLRELPIGGIKIDRRFVSGLCGVDRNEAIFGSVVELARKLQTTVTAEGIETQEQLDVVRALGCSQAQGYLLGRPVPAQDLRVSFPPQGKAKLVA